jgi:hypothetical protein
LSASIALTEQHAAGDDELRSGDIVRRGRRQKRRKTLNQKVASSILPRHPIGSIAGPGEIGLAVLFLSSAGQAPVSTAA